jgi:RNA polymerase sigma-70 factor, ECF subfamily
VVIDVLLNNPHITRSALSELHEGAWQWALQQLDGDRDAADDVMQTVYVMLLEGRAHFENRSSLKTWLYAVVRHTCRRHRRDLARQQRLLLQYFRNALTQPDVPQKFDVDSLSAQDPLSPKLSNALRRLPPRQREVIELTLLRDFTLAQCAEILNLSIGSVRTHYHRAKENLRAQVPDWVNDHD